MEYSRQFCALCSEYSVHCYEVGGTPECLHHRSGKTCHACGVNVMEIPRYQYGNMSYCVPCHEEGIGKIAHIVVGPEHDWPKAS